MRRYAGTSVVIAVLLACLSAAGALPAHAQAALDRDSIEIRDYRLTMAKFEKYTAAMETLAKLAESRPDLEKEESLDTSAGLAEWIKYFEKHPEVVAVLRQHGFSPREYCLINFAWIFTSIAVELKKAGIQDLPPEASSANIAFYEQNYDKIQALWKKLEAMGTKKSRAKPVEEEEEEEEKDEP